MPPLAATYARQKRRCWPLEVALAEVPVPDSIRAASSRFEIPDGRVASRTPRVREGGLTSGRQKDSYSWLVLPSEYDRLGCYTPVAENALRVTGDLSCRSSRARAPKRFYAENAGFIEIVQAFMGNAEKILLQLFRVVTLQLRGWPIAVFNAARDLPSD